MKRTSSDRSQPQARAAGFTLVEMLAVISIILLLTTLAVYSIRGVNGATSRRAAVGSLMSVFDQARMTAVSDGRPTYVVFASAPEGQSQTTSVLPDSMWGRAYALFEDNAITDSSSATNFYPLQRSAWLYLPTGVAFKCKNDDSISRSLTASTVVAGATQFQIQSRTGASTVPSPMTLPYVKFDATGQIVDYNGNILDAGSPALRVLIFEGIASNSSVETYTHQSAINATDGKKYALDEVLLKPTTGRAEYTLDPVNNFASAATPTP